MLTVIAAVVIAQAPLQPRVGFTSDTVRVGDPVGVVVQLDLERAASFTAPDTLDLSGNVENAAPRRLQLDTLANGNVRYRLLYPITAWRPGALLLPELTLVVGAQAVRIPLGTLTVSSVLPPDTANIQPKPPRDVWGANRVWWPILLLAVLLLALLALAIWWWRRRRPPAKEETTPTIPLVMPREWALSELDRLAAQRLIERGEHQRYHVELSRIIRIFLDRTDGGWGTDLTTTELADRMYAARVDARVPVDVLQRADLVKFARQQPGAEQARQDLNAIRGWVESFVKPGPLELAA